jgi:hypothetical protein
VALGTLNEVQLFALVVSSTGKPAVVVVNPDGSNVGGYVGGGTGMSTGLDLNTATLEAYVTSTATGQPALAIVNPDGSDVLFSVVLGLGVVNISNCDSSIQGSAAAGAANGIAQLGSTGLVPTAQEGTGSASSSTFLRGDQTWATPSGTGVSSVTAGDTSIVIGGTSTAPTVETGTLDVIAADHPPAANWSNNSHKITSLANGSAAQDAAAFGQLPSGTNLLPEASGGTGQTTTLAGLKGDTLGKGHLLVGTGSAIADFSPGSNGSVPIFDSSATDGVRTPTLNPAPRYTSGVLGWSWDIAAPASVSAALPAAANLYFCRIPLDIQISVTNITIILSTLASSTLTNCYVALFSSSGTIIGQSADQHSTWQSGGSTGVKTIALASGPFTCTPASSNDWLWAAVYVGTAAGTLPQFGTGGNNTNAITLGQTAATSRFGNISQANTSTLASFTPSSATTNGYTLWAALN